MGTGNCVDFDYSALRMKLIRCKKCNDVVRLIHREWRTCDCGKSGGQYNDDMLSATVGGLCEVIGIRNDFFVPNIKKRIGKEGIIQGEYKGDVQIQRIISGKGPKLKMDIERFSKDLNKLTFKDRRKYTINLKGNKSPKFIFVPYNKIPSFKGKK